MEYISSRIRGEGGAFMAPGTVNAMVSGSQLTRAFRGVAVQGSVMGSRVFFNVDQSFAGLGTASSPGVGSVFGVRQLLMAIGQGQVAFAGTALAGFIASSMLSFVAKVGGVYDPSVIYQSGHIAPAAPVIYARAPSPGQTAMSAAISVVIWRVDEFGQVSNASLPSNVLVLAGQSVVVTFPALDTNGQTRWGIGVPKPGFEDLGNFYELPTSLGGEPLDSALTTIDGHPRAIEISWTAQSLIGQRLAPNQAFPPFTGQFADAFNDVIFLDSDGIIYVSLPNEIGSFPPSQALFASEPAVAYLTAFGMRLRFGHHTLGVLMYVGGSPALEYQEVWRHLGIALQQNVAVGHHGRVMAWLGKPTVIDNTSTEPDWEYATKVQPDFDGWDANNNSTTPIVPFYDGIGEYECWAQGTKVMAQYCPTKRWCSPIDLSGKVLGPIVSAYTQDRQAYLCSSSGFELGIHKWDFGSGSVMTVQTSDVRPNGYEQAINQIRMQGRLESIGFPVKLELIKDYDDAHPILISGDARGNPGGWHTGAQEFPIPDPDIFATSHALKVTMTSLGGSEMTGLPFDTGLDLIETMGPPPNEVNAS